MGWIRLLLVFLSCVSPAFGLAIDGRAGDWEGEPLLRDRLGDASESFDIAALHARLDARYLYVCLVIPAGPSQDGAQTATYGFDVDVTGSDGWDYEVLVGGDGHGGVGPHSLWRLPETGKPHALPAWGMKAAIGRRAVEIAVPRSILGPLRFPVRFRGISWSQSKKEYADFVLGSGALSEALDTLLTEPSPEGPLLLSIDGASSDWVGCDPLALDGVGDATIETPGVDLVSVRALRTETDLLCHMETAGPPILDEAGHTVYFLNVRTHAEADGPTWSFQVGLFGPAREMFGQVVWVTDEKGEFTRSEPVDGILGVASEEGLEFRIPLDTFPTGTSPFHVQAFTWRRDEGILDRCPNRPALAGAVPPTRVQFLPLARTFEADYRFTVKVTSALERLDIFVPRPTTWPLQPDVKLLELSGPRPGAEPDLQSLPGTGDVLHYALIDVPPADYTIRQRFRFTAIARQEIPPTDAKDGTEEQALLASTDLVPSEDPKIRALARDIVQEARSERDRLRRLYDWVHDEIRYTDEGDMVGARKAFTERVGNCGDHSALLVALCRASNIPARVVAGYLEGESQQHVWAEAKLGTNWLPLDASYKRRRLFGILDSGRLILSKGTDLELQGKKTHHCPILQRGFYWYYGPKAPTHSWEITIREVEDK